MGKYQENYTSFTNELREFKCSTIEQQLKGVFSDHSLQTKADKARQILGGGAIDISDDQLEPFTAQIDYLVNCWLDTYERHIFKGKTLREITKSDTS